MPNAERRSHEPNFRLQIRDFDTILVRLYIKSVGLIFQSVVLYIFCVPADRFIVENHTIRI